LLEFKKIGRKIKSVFSRKKKKVVKAKGKKEEPKKVKLTKKELMKKAVKMAIIPAIAAILLFVGTFLFLRQTSPAFTAAGFGFVLLFVYMIARIKLIAIAKIKKMELVFPDFIELMSSNLRAGMTTDKALLLSSRKEFHPLDDEILILGKEIMTGKDMGSALTEMSKRIKSEKIEKTINIITSGIKSGGNLAVLLEETAVNMRERNFVEKRASSNVSMYIIFIVFAIAVGAPTLFSLSAVLVQVLTNILVNIPQIDSSINTPVSLSSINISLTFITYFSMIFLMTINILASLMLGLVMKGEEKEGIKYMLPMIAVSLTVYVVIRTILIKYFGDIG